jgi:hypothetical protein
MDPVQQMSTALVAAWPPYADKLRDKPINYDTLGYLYSDLEKIEHATCPFVNPPEKKRGRSGQGITLQS